MRAGLLCLGLLMPVGVSAETDLGDMTRAEREAFGAEVRAALLDAPQIVAPALGAGAAMQTAVRDAFRDEVNEDLDLLARLSPEVLAGHDIALFIRPDCTACEQSAMELRALSARSGATFILHDMSDIAQANLADGLGIDMAPSYVLPDMVLRGHMPEVVLMRYLAR